MLTLPLSVKFWRNYMIALEIGFLICILMIIIIFTHRVIVPSARESTQKKRANLLLFSFRCGQNNGVCVHYELVGSGISFKIIYRTRNIYYGLGPMRNTCISNMKNITNGLFDEFRYMRSLSQYTFMEENFP